MPTPDDSRSARRGEVIAGRYTLGDEIDRGGASIVYEATDGVSGAHVAVKLLHPGGAHIGDRARREIAALRLLRLPGVVALQDEGVHGDAPFLVMDLVHGVPFPGRAVPVDWPDLAAPTLSLLETLARVHAAGVVHRDLKPSNVFVGEDLNVTLLDFGISWGPALGEALTAVGGVVGTPEYLAPEQLTGVRGDPRSDLYTVGVLLYEALTGRLPHMAKTFGELTHLKMTVTPVSVRRLAPEIPRRVAQTIERLLLREPDDRPQSVGELMVQLYDREVTERLTSPLPRLGDTELPGRIAMRVMNGESVDITGPLGTGRSRLLSDVSEELAALGRLPRWTPPGAAPYASALALLEDMGSVDELSQAELEERLLAGFRRGAEHGAVFLIDDPDQVDGWSAAIFERARQDGGFVRIVHHATDGCVELSRLTEKDLRPLFAGPDRIFHLREDGAAELFRRTGGLPYRVATQVGAWVRASLAHWRDGKLVITRDALQRLAGGLPVITSTTRAEDDEPDSPGLQELLAWITLAWPHTSEDVLARATKRPRWRLQPELEELSKRHRITRLEDGRYQPVASSMALRVWPADRLREAHRSLADSLPPGTPDRLRHLAAAGGADEIISEALQRGDALDTAGRYSDALVALELGLVAARRVDDAEAERTLLCAIANVCLDDGGREPLQQGLYQLGRALHRDDELTRIERLMVIARDAASGPPEELLASLAALGPMRDQTFEQWRRGQQYQISIRLGPEREATMLDELDAWAVASGDPRAVANVQNWRLLQQFHSGRSLESAQAAERAAGTSRNETIRLMHLINAAWAYADAGELDDCERVAQLARQEAIACRAALTEAHADSLLRQVEYQRGQASTLDVELIDAVATIGDSVLDAKTTMTEAAIAWRAGDLPLALRLARRTTEACRTWAEPGCDVLPRSFEIVCGAEPEEGEIESLVETARSTPDADTAVQTLGLLALACPERAPALRADAARRARELTFADPDTRRVVLSVTEATEGLQRSRPETTRGDRDAAAPGTEGG